MRKLSAVVAAVTVILLVGGTYATEPNFNNPGYSYTNILDVGPLVDTTEAQFSWDGTKILWSEREKNESGTYYIRKAVKYGDWNAATKTISNIVTVAEISDAGGVDSLGYAKWSPDDTYIAYGIYESEVSNEIRRYKLSNSTHETFYAPAEGVDWGNFDFFGNNSSLVFWDYGTGGSVADLFIYNKTTDTRSALTATADYKEYEPRVYMTDNSQVLYWSGETTAEPYRSVHILNGDTSITDVALGTSDHNYFWPVWGKDQDHIGIVDHGSDLWNGDLLLYEKVGDTWQLAEDLTGDGYNSESIIFFGSFNADGSFCFSYEQDDGSRDIYFAAVPEPATMLLMGTALAGLIGVVRRRRKA